MACRDDRTIIQGKVGRKAGATICNQFNCSIINSGTTRIRYIDRNHFGTDEIKSQIDTGNGDVIR